MGDSSKACFKCGKMGHFAWACHYNSKKRDAAPGNSNSGNGGYASDKKPDRDSIKSKVTRCYLCRKLGHLARSCPAGGAAATSTTTGPMGKYYDLDRPSENKRNEDDDDDDDAPPPPTLGNYVGYDVDDNILTQALDSMEERGWDFIKNDNETLTKQHSKIHQQKDDKYHKNVFLNNSKFNGYLDTCSEKCLIKYTAAKRAQLNVQLDDTDVMSNSPSFKGKIISIGKALTTVNVDNMEITNVEMYVVADDVLNIDVVIGRSWLDHPQVVMIKLDNQVYIANINEHHINKIRDMLQPAPKTHLDIVTSDEDAAGRNDVNKHMSPKRHRHNYPHTKNNDSSPRKSHPMFERPPRNMSRERSRSRERLRVSLRDERLGKSSSRRSRERSRERYMRHGGGARR